MAALTRSRDGRSAHRALDMGSMLSSEAVGYCRGHVELLWLLHPPKTQGCTDYCLGLTLEFHVQTPGLCPRCLCWDCRLVELCPDGFVI